VETTVRFPKVTQNRTDDITCMSGRGAGHRETQLSKRIREFAGLSRR
jgi:hypothetical protein